MWEMTGEHSEVASFDCQKAECDFRGRRWEAWFTPEIPVSEGPWKLKGLPGLILYARDTTGQYSFEAVSVTDSPEPFYDVQALRAQLLPLAEVLQRGDDGLHRDRQWHRGGRLPELADALLPDGVAIDSGLA